MTELTDRDFFALFNGKETISGHALGYEQAYKFIYEEEGEVCQKRMFSCVLFFEKPIQFLATGKTKKGKGDGKAVDKKLLEYLPILSDDEIALFEKPRDKKKFGAFICVNFTKVRRVALLAVEKNWLKHDVVNQWIKGYGGRPTMYQTYAPKWTKMDSTQTGSEQREIKIKMLEEFKSEFKIWEAFTIEGLDE